MKLPLEHIRAVDAMHAGIVSCAAELDISAVARIVADRHLHAVAVIDHQLMQPIGFVSDLNVMAAPASGAPLNARQTAATEFMAIASTCGAHGLPRDLTPGGR